MTSFSLKFEVAFNVNPGTEPGVGDWTDLSARVRTAQPVTVKMGAGRLAGGATASASLLLDNLDRAIDPTNPSATYNLVPMRHARLQATVASTTYPLFRGFVGEWPPTWSPNDSTVSVQLVDGFTWLALQDADLDLPQQMSNVRIVALLDEAGWSATLRDIGTGVVELEPVEQNSANLLRSLQDAADAENGDLYVAADGKITFRSRHARFGRTITETFGVGGIDITGAVPVWDTARLTNIARSELANGDVYESIDDASVTAYGPRVLPIRDLALTPAEAQGLAQWEVYRFGEQHLWVNSLTVTSAEAGALVAALTADIGDLVTVAHTPPAGGAIDADMCIERITHSIGPKVWITSYDLSPDFGAGPWLTLDDATLGVLDSTNVLGS